MNPDCWISNSTSARQGQLIETARHVLHSNCVERCRKKSNRMNRTTNSNNLTSKLHKLDRLELRKMIRLRFFPTKNYFCEAKKNKNTPGTNLWVQQSHRKREWPLICWTKFIYKSGSIVLHFFQLDSWNFKTSTIRIRLEWAFDYFFPALKVAELAPGHHPRLCRNCAQVEAPWNRRCGTVNLFPQWR